MAAMACPTCEERSPEGSVFCSNCGGHLPDARRYGDPAPAAAGASSVAITRIDIPFLDLVGFFVKAAIAAVPATIIVAIFWAILAGLFGGIFAAIGS